MPFAVNVMLKLSNVFALVFALVLMPLDTELFATICTFKSLNV